MQSRWSLKRSLNKLPKSRSLLRGKNRYWRVANIRMLSNLSKALSEININSLYFSTVMVVTSANYCRKRKLCLKTLLSNIFFRFWMDSKVYIVLMQCIETSKYKMLCFMINVAKLLIWALESSWLLWMMSPKLS